MKIVIPLKSGEPLREHGFRGQVVVLKPEDCIEPFGHEYFAEIGKYYTFTRSDAFHEALDRNEDIALIQNNKAFNGLDEISVRSTNEVVLCKAQKFDSLTVETQFKKGHTDAAPMFDEVVKLMNVPIEAVQMDRCCFHNMMVAKPAVVKEYLEFLMGVLMKLFKPEHKKKYGAYLAERILDFWCIMNGKSIIERDFTIFKKH